MQCGTAVQVLLRRHTASVALASALHDGEVMDEISIEECRRNSANAGPKVDIVPVIATPCRDESRCVATRCENVGTTTDSRWQRTKARNYFRGRTTPRCDHVSRGLMRPRHTAARVGCFLLGRRLVTALYRGLTPAAMCFRPCRGWRRQGSTTQFHGDPIWR